MAVGLCLPPSIKEKLRGAFASGDVNMETLYHLKGEDLNTVFSHYVGKDSASLVSAVFEKAKIDATKAAAADYVTASKKDEFKQAATGGKFAQKILSDAQTKKLAIDKIDQTITNTKARLKAVTDKAATLTGEAKANAELKASKLQDQIDRLNVRKEDTQNPSSDRMLAKLKGLKTLLGNEDYQNLVNAKMGQEVSPAQGKYIGEQITKLEELAKQNKNDIGGVTDEYLQAKGSLDSFINNMNPAPDGVSIVKGLVEIVKNNFITSIATPLKTGFSAITNNPAGYIIRRLSNLSLTGIDSGFAKEIKQNNWKTMMNTGSNKAAMNSLDDASMPMGSAHGDPTLGKNFTTNETYNAPTLGGKVKGVIGAIEKGVSKAAQVSHYVAIDLEHNYQFARIYASAFADTLNFRALDVAKAEAKLTKAQIADGAVPKTKAELKVRAKEIMRDAAKIEPTTASGKTLRAAGQEAAMRVLNVNDTYASRFSVSVKNGLNAMNPNIPVGTLLEPFAKIPANVIENGIKTTPVGALPAGWEAVKGKWDMRASNPMETRIQGAIDFKTGIEKLIGVVGSVGIATLITNQLTKKDFRSDAYGNHFVHMGGFWINTEYISRIAPNIAGIMAMKQNPKENPIQAFATGNKVGQGALGGILNMPGIDNVNQVVQTALGSNAVKTTISNTESAAVPAIAGNALKNENIPSFPLHTQGTDDNMRTLGRLLFGASGVETDAQYHQDNVDKNKKAVASRAANAKAKRAANK